MRLTDHQRGIVVINHRFTARLATALLGLGLLAACENSTEPIVLDQMVAVSGDAQFGRVGSQLAEPLVVQVNDLNGNGVRGVRVAWEVIIGDGSVSSAQTTTNGAGQTEVRFTLGSLPSVQGVMARVAEPGIDNLSVEFGANATP